MASYYELYHYELYNYHYSIIIMNSASATERRRQRRWTCAMEQQISLR